MPGLEYKALALDQKQALEALASDPGQLIGYASVFNGVDAYNDTILPGAYADTIPSFVERGTLHAEHDSRIRLGTIASAREDDHGLLIAADFHSTPEAQSVRTQILERMERGKFVGLSIGYQAEDFETRSDGVRVLKRIKLYEVSEVTVPADEQAGVIAAKARRLIRKNARHLQRKDWDGDDDEPISTFAEGSFEQLAEDLEEAFEAVAIPAGTRGYAEVVATYADRFVAVLTLLDANGYVDPIAAEDPVYYQVPYVANGDGSFTLGTPVVVEPETTFTTPDPGPAPLSMLSHRLNLTRARLVRHGIALGATS
jgi:HK97 family phage prohead protease